jgi:hypothetical protein
LDAILSAIACSSSMISRAAVSLLVARVLGDPREELVARSHWFPPHHELSEGDAAERRTAAIVVRVVRLDNVDKAGERAAVVELVAANLERHARKRAEDGAPARAVDALAAADEGRQGATRPLNLPDPIQTGHSD